VGLLGSFWPMGGPGVVSLGGAGVFGVFSGVRGWRVLFWLSRGGDIGVPLGYPPSAWVD